MMYDDKLVIVEMDTMTTYGLQKKGRKRQMKQYSALISIIRMT